MKYFEYKKLGKYQAKLKWCVSRLQEKDNSSYVTEFSEKARVRLQKIAQQQALDSAWNTYHNIDSKTVNYNPHEKEILEAMAHMQSSENGWKTADDMLSVCNSLEVPWYARGFLRNREDYVTWLFLIIFIMFIVTAWFVIFGMYPKWMGVVGIIVLLFAFFL